MHRSLSAAAVFSLACLLLCGCAPTAGETAGSAIDDATITAEAKAAIAEEPEARYGKIDAATTEGIVVVTGSVDSKSAQDRLLGKIEQIRGVKSVKSMLRIEQRR